MDSFVVFDVVCQTYIYYTTTIFYFDILITPSCVWYSP